MAALNSHLERSKPCRMLSVAPNFFTLRIASIRKGHTTWHPAGPVRHTRCRQHSRPELSAAKRFLRRLTGWVVSLADDLPHAKDLPLNEIGEPITCNYSMRVKKRGRSVTFLHVILNVNAPSGVMQSP